MKNIAKINPVYPEIIGVKGFVKNTKKEN